MGTSARPGIPNTAGNPNTVLWFVNFRFVGKVRSFCSVRQFCSNFWYLISQLGKKNQRRNRKTRTYKRRNQNGAKGRAVQSPRVVFNNPNQPCYTRFFVGGVPPTGLRTGQNLQNIRYICQTLNQQTYYSTMFDENRGIAVFSGYTVTQANRGFLPDRPRPRWRQTQGSYSLAIYKIK